jgi:hypothetical protein
MPPDSEGDYEVGYGKPPRETRFAKGQSGNPRGRPSGAKNFKTLLSDALNVPVIVTENSGRRKVTKRQAIITQLVNRSATPDWRAIKILLDLVRDIEGQTEPASPETSAFSEADEAAHRESREIMAKQDLVLGRGHTSRTAPRVTRTSLPRAAGSTW